MDISEIGLIYDMTNPENPVALDGWHVNTLQPIVDAEQYLVAPNTPKFGVLGVPNNEVYHYRFESQNQADSYLPAEINYNGYDIN